MAAICRVLQQCSPDNRGQFVPRDNSAAVIPENQPIAMSTGLSAPVRLSSHDVHLAVFHFQPGGNTGAAPLGGPRLP
jgi:hypothetical protein